jgi:hypothetical protein
MLFTKEHYELMAAFEKEFKGYRLDREKKSQWTQGNIYQSGETNMLFLAFRKGYAVGKTA